MIDSYEIGEFSQRSEEIINRLRERPEGTVLKSKGKPQAVVLPYPEYQEYLAWHASQEKRQAWLKELQRIADEVSARAGLSEEEAAELAERSYRETLGG
jgi:PHD/YefM family antitoxin component YafN of YafNO toxin-antitoxin module